MEWWGSSFTFIVPAYPAYVQDYLDRVTAADVSAGNTQGLEQGVTDALSGFLKDYVATGWLGVSGNVISQAASVIKAMPIMAGARTIPGCIVPVVGPAPTNIGFVSGDYDRKTGLLGGGTKRLDSNRNSNADPQNSYHNFLNVTQHTTATAVYMGCGPATNENGATNIGRASTLLFSRNRSAANGGATFSSALGLFGTTRQASASFTAYTPASATLAISSQTPFAGNIFVFSSSNGALPAAIRANYYSIGEYVDGALMSSKVATLMSALAAAIP